MIGYTTGVNLNSANTDTAITIILPNGITNYRINNIFIQNTGTTASLTTATGGVFSSTGGGGVSISANQALSGLTSNAINTATNLIGLGGVTAIALNPTTLYFRVGTAQGAAATGNVYIYGFPLPN